MKLPDLKEKILKDKRIFIIEGIAGAGKDTLQKKLKTYYEKKGFAVYDFCEEELLFSWKHFWIKNLDLLKIEYMHRVLDCCIDLIKDPNNLIILNRFHITYPLMAKFDKKAKEKYDLLITRLQNLPVHIFIGTLPSTKIEKRSAHNERKGKMWIAHRKKRLEHSGFKTLKQLYTSEQEKVFSAAKKQGINYSTFDI